METVNSTVGGDVVTGTAEAQVATPAKAPKAPKAKAAPRTVKGAVAKPDAEAVPAALAGLTAQQRKALAGADTAASSFMGATNNLDPNAWVVMGAPPQKGLRPHNARAMGAYANLLVGGPVQAKVLQAMCGGKGCTDGRLTVPPSNPGYAVRHGWLRVVAPPKGK